MLRSIRTFLALGTLGLRFLRGAATMRSFMVIISSAVASSLLFAAIAIPVLIQRQEVKTSALRPMLSSYYVDWIRGADGELVPPAGSMNSQQWQPQPLHSMDWNSTLIVYSQLEQIRNQVANFYDLKGEGPVPPGIPTLPSPGVSYASPALIRLIETNTDVSAFFIGMKVKPISDAGLSSPEDLIAYRWLDTEKLGIDILQGLESYELNYVYSWGQKLDPDLNFGLLALVIGALGIPVVALILSTARLSAQVRERRLASLRLLGLSKSRTRFLASIEIALTSMVGSFLGLGIFVSFAYLSSGKVFQSYSWFAQDLIPDVWGVALGVSVAPLLAILSALLPLIRISRKPLETLKRAQSGRPSFWRLLPLILGIGALIVVIRWPVWDERGFTMLIGTAGKIFAGVFFGGTLLLAIGVPLGLPIVVRIISRLIAEKTQNPTVLLAARGSQYDPSSMTRIITTFLVVLFVSSTGAGALAVQTTSAEYQYALHQLTEGPNMMTVAIETPVIEDTAPNIPVEKPTFSAVKQKLLQIKGVRQVFEIEQWIVNDPETQSSALNINVFPCSFVEEFQLFKNECVPGQLLFPDKNFLEINMVQKYFLEGAQIRIASDSISGASTGTFTLPPMRLEKVAVTDNFWTSGLMSEVIMTDSSPLFSNRVSEDHLWIASTAPGLEVQEQIYQAARSLNPRLYIRSTGNQELIESYERSQFVLRGLTGIALMIAIFALLVTTIDRSRERQREFTMQRVGGISSRIVKSAQYLQVVLPFFIGSVVAGIVSLLASQALLHVMIREKYAIQWSALYVTVSLSLLAAFITVLALSMSVGSKINPANLRRE